MVEEINKNQVSNDLMYLTDIDKYIECLDYLDPISNLNLLNNELTLFATAMEKLPLDSQQLYWTVIEAFQTKFEVIDKLDQNSIIYILGHMDEYIKCLNYLDPIANLNLLNNEMTLFITAMKKLPLDSQQLCWPVIEAFQNQFQKAEDLKKDKRKRYSL